MNLFIIFIGLFFCHYLADYTWLSTSYMLNAKRFGTPLFPIFCHAMMQTCLMGIFLFIMSFIIPLSSAIVFDMLIFQLMTHFVFDTLKGKLTFKFKALQDISNKWYWVTMGGDQFLHNIVIVIMALLLVL